MGNIQMIGKSNAEAMRGEQPEKTNSAPEWTLSDVAEHAVDFWLTTEDLPLAENRVTTDKDGNIHLDYSATNGEEADRLYGELKKIPQPRGDGRSPRAAQELLHGHGHPARRLRPPGGNLPVRHRPGHLGPRLNCKAHEVDNLYVVDTSFFPSIGAVNPALTAMANALRVADHLLSRMAEPARGGAMIPLRVVSPPDVTGTLMPMLRSEPAVMNLTMLPGAVSHPDGDAVRRGPSPRVGSRC